MSIHMTMKALVKSSSSIEYRDDIPVPTIGASDILIKVISASICGSDLHIYHNDPALRDRIEEGLVIGHEFCGEVIELGEQVKTLTNGDIVAVESHISCGSCYYCRNGLPHICQEISAIGFDYPGGFAQYAVVPAENAIILPSNIHPDIGACLEPFGNTVYALRRIDLVNKVAWIIGCGSQGLMAIALSKASGARKIIATEVKMERLVLAHEMSKLHSNLYGTSEDLILNPYYDPEYLSKIYQATNGLGVDVVIEMSGNPTAIADGLLALKGGGFVIAVGLTNTATTEIAWNKGIVLKEATVMGVYGRRSYQTWTEATYFIGSGKVNLEPLIYPKKFELVDYQEAFELVSKGSVTKVIFKPNS